jgi:hypothetical protein
MSFGHTMRCALTTEIPSFHDTLETFTFAGTYDVNKLSNVEMSWAQHVTNWKEVLRSHLKLSQVRFWWETVFQEVANLWLNKFL